MAVPPTRTTSAQPDRQQDVTLPELLPTGGETAAPLNAPESFVPSWVPRSPPTTPATVWPMMPKEGIPAENVDLQISLDDQEAEDAQQLTDVAIDAAPPWLISLVFHMVLILVLAFLLVANALTQKIDLTATFSDTFGEQIEHDTFDVADIDSNEAPVLTTTDMTSTDDPLASPHSEAAELPHQLMASATFEAPNVGLALSGREPGMKETLLLAYGGDRITEGAVTEALKWLERNQRRDGSWRLDGPYADGSSVRNPVAATAMALLAFQGAGFTHKSTRNVITDSGDKQELNYRRVVRRGWTRMKEWQGKDGNFWKLGGVDHPHHRLYSHAQATIAVCELYGMTRDENLRRPAQLAVNYCCDIQDEDGVEPDGGWKYDPHRDSDLSVTGWFVMALQSARMAGLDVPSDVFDKVSKFLDSVTDEGSYYAYMPGYNSKPSLTAEGLLCRQYLGWKRDDQRLVEGADYLARNPVDWSDTNTYYWYYATQVMHHMEGDAWFEWNRVMAKEIPAKQVTSGPEKGSWSPDGDIWGQGGGRLYMTCMCTYMLEVYYRHLPIYSKAF